MRGTFPGRVFPIALVAFSLAFWAEAGQAQVINGNQWPQPRLTIVTPCGGQAGSTVEVAWTGTDVADPQALIFSHPGIKATPIIPPPPKVDPKAKPDPAKKDPPPQPVTKFSVAIAKDVPPGYYDVRFVNKLGVSNPRVFVVGTGPEVMETEPNNDVDKLQKVEVGTTINGAISAPTDVDYTQFAGKKGQRLLITCLASSIDSRLNPELVLLDAAGRKIGEAHPLPGQDALLDVTLPADGDYLLRLAQFTYTVGGPEYFYRLHIGTAPYIDAVLPPMIEPGKPAQVTLIGRNLPGGKAEPGMLTTDGKQLEKLTVTVTPPADASAAQRLAFLSRISPEAAMLDGFEYRISGPGGLSNAVLITYATAPVILEKADNDTPEKAQDISVPCEVAGQMEKRRDRDWYAFEAKKGDIFIIEVLSQRLGASTDMVMSLRNQAAKPPAEITVQDDNPDVINIQRLYTFSKDPPPYRFVVPADGKYHIMLRNQEGDNYADASHVYRMRISREKPDFRLIVMHPDAFRHDSFNLLQGGQETFAVFAQRLDGFKGDVTLSVEGLPTGVTCPQQILAGTMRSTHLVVGAADNAPDFTGEVKVVGTAMINGQKVVREARPASITWPVQPQQNIPAVTRLERQLMVGVRGKTPGKLNVAKDKVRVFHGDKLEIPLKLIRVSPEFAKVNFQVTPVPGDFPPNLNFGNLAFNPGKDDLSATFTVANNVPPGKYNLVFRGFAPIPPDAKAKPVNTVINSNPVELTVIPKQVANLTVDNPNPTVKLGKEEATMVLVVRVARQFDFDGEFKVDLVLPKEAQGVVADNIVIPAGQSEAKLTLKVPASAAPGNRQNLTVRAVAMLYGDVALTHETKINVNVVK